MLETIIFFIIFNDFLAISRLLCIIDIFTACGEHSPMVDLFLSMCLIPSWRICVKFLICNNKKGRQLEVNAKWTKIQRKFHKVRVVLGVLGHAESGYSLYFWLYCSFRRYRSFFVGTLDNYFRIFNQNWADQLCRIMPFSQPVGNSMNFRFFQKK